MDKNAIKKYAVWARNELIARVTQKAEQYEITEKKTTPAEADSIGGRLLSEAEKKQRASLIEKIKTDGFEQVMEEVAYIWFNRFTALRFMEVNNYLPSHTRVFTNEAGEFKPQILTDAIQLDLEGLNMDKVFELKDANKTEELYKYLLITQCNALSGVLPRMFQKIAHYTELLLPDYLLREGSVIEQMIALIPEEDWTDQVQIIGWLYQYYNSEPKDAVFAALKKNVKISKENIPAATQLFTPDWIVRYMVENSLGRLWLEGHPNDTLKSEWKYYLDEAEQEADVQRQLDEIRKEYAALKPEEIRCIDPCMGSGHILCYMFDVLVKIYEDYGYTAREAVENIVEKNLWGLDIDERAAQLSYFAVMMKARQYDRRFFNKKDENGELCIPQPHVYAIEESNGITSAPMHDMGIGLSQEEYGKAVKEAMRLVEEMHDAKEYGSIIHVTPCDWNLLRRFAVPRWISEGQMRMDIHGEIEASERLQVLINVGESLSQKYHAVVTNPPYMGGSGMGAILSNYLKKNYPNSKSDLFAVFMERCGAFTSRVGFFSMITQNAWMFLASFEKLRNEIERKTIINMSHLGARAFDEIAGEVVQTTAFVATNKKVDDYVGTYVRLVDVSGEAEKEKLFISNRERYYSRQEDFLKIPGHPVAYWASDNILKAFDEGQFIGDFTDVKIGMGTGKNDIFVREWWEVEKNKIDFSLKSIDQLDDSKGRYFPYNKGGEYRLWYGNLLEVLWFDAAGRKYMNSMSGHRENGGHDYYFRHGLTWTFISSSRFGVRSLPYGFLFDVAGSTLFVDDDKLDYVLGFLSSSVCNGILKLLNPTLNYQAGNVKSLPVLFGHKEEVDEIVKANIQISKSDWDSFETSWDFLAHPLINGGAHLSEVYNEWENTIVERFRSLKNNEEHMNELFIDTYSVEDEISPVVQDGEVTVHNIDKQRDIRSLISYAVGCMFGRYSLDFPGVIYAGGEWDDNKYISFKPDKDAIIPICDDEYFEDDIVGRFVKFIEVVYGKESLEENLSFISEALGGKGVSREVIRNYFINDFYSDHLKIYQKRPIYWMFDSGKKNGFKCLVYIHRYRPDTIARIRTDYVHEQQSRYRTAIADFDQRVSNASASDRVRLNKQLATIRDQAEELRLYEEKIHHLADQMISINLDDGVKHNYELLKDVLAKLK